jgi:hypothetical protein
MYVCVLVLLVLRFYVSSYYGYFADVRREAYDSAPNLGAKSDAVRLELVWRFGTQFACFTGTNVQMLTYC